MDGLVSELVEAVYIWSGEVWDLRLVEGEEPGRAFVGQWSGGWVGSWGGRSTRR
jgi:hypothetical protein